MHRLLYTHNMIIYPRKFIDIIRFERNNAIDMYIKCTGIERFTIKKVYYLLITSDNMTHNS